MIVTHQFRIVALCPVDERTDVYDATLTLDHQSDVEMILEHVRTFEAQQVYQEDLTVHLAEILGGTLTTVGTHSGVVTTVTAG